MRVMYEFTHGTSSDSGNHKLRSHHSATPTDSAMPAPCWHEVQREQSSRSRELDGTMICPMGMRISFADRAEGY